MTAIYPMTSPTEVSVPSSASLEAKLDAATCAMTELRRAIIDSSKRARVIPNLSAQAVADANGYALIVFPTVPTDRRWEVRQLVVGGATMAATATGTATVFTSGMQTAPDASVPLYSVADYASTLPKVAFYLEDQIPVMGGEALQVQIASGTSTDTYYATVTFVDLPL